MQNMHVHCLSPWSGFVEFDDEVIEFATGRVAIHNHSAFRAVLSDQHNSGRRKKADPITEVHLRTTGENIHRFAVLGRVVADDLVAHNDVGSDLSEAVELTDVLLVVREGIVRRSRRNQDGHADENIEIFHFFLLSKFF